MIPISTYSEIRNFITAHSANIPFLTTYTSIYDKENSIEQYISYMLDRTRQMFEYKNLPKTIPAYMLELYLQIFGYAAIVKVDETLPIHNPKSTINFQSGTYALYGAIGGELDLYFRPRLFIPANPRIPSTINANIIYDESEISNIPSPHAVIIKNDTQQQGLIPLFSRYAQQLVENDISIRSAQINARASIGISVSTDSDRESALKFLDDLEAGKLGILGETSFLEGISIANISPNSSNTIIQLIELQQYLKASWYNELGLNVNFNMKREYMSEEEIAVNTDILLPLVDDMYQCRVEAIDIINKAFDLNIEVSKSSAWANKQQEELSALGEAAAASNVPLASTIQKTIETISGEKDAIQSQSEQQFQSTEQKSQESIQSDVQEKELSKGQDSITNGNDRTDSSRGTEESGISTDTGEGFTSGGPDKVEVTVNVNIEGGDDKDVSIRESETQEESEESDAE